MIKIKNAYFNRIKGVFFDYGGVLENLALNPETLKKGIGIIKDILKNKGVSISEDELSSSIKKGQTEYSTWCKSQNLELPNEKIWSSFLLKDYCKSGNVKNIVEGSGEQLSSIYEYYMFKRRPVKEMKPLLQTLSLSGYTLALISNTISNTLIPERLRKFDVQRYFSAILLSVVTGIRKPRREIFEAALVKTGLSGGQCIYVGDTLSRDVEGSKNAGFYKSILLKSGLTGEKDSEYKGDYLPDFTITTLDELYAILK